MLMARGTMPAALTRNLMHTTARAPLVTSEEGGGRTLAGTEGKAARLSIHPPPKAVAVGITRTCIPLSQTSPLRGATTSAASAAGSALAAAAQQLLIIAALVPSSTERPPPLAGATATIIVVLETRTIRSATAEATATKGRRVPSTVTPRVTWRGKASARCAGNRRCRLLRRTERLLVTAHCTVAAPLRLQTRLLTLLAGAKPRTAASLAATSTNSPRPRPRLRRQ